MIRYITIRTLVSIYSEHLTMALVFVINYMLVILCKNFIINHQDFENQSEECIKQINNVMASLNNSELIILCSSTVLFLTSILHPIIIKCCRKETYLSILFLLYCLSPCIELFYQKPLFLGATDTKFPDCLGNNSDAFELISLPHIIYSIFLIVFLSMTIITIGVGTLVMILFAFIHGIYFIYDKIKLYTIPYYECTLEFEDEDKNNDRNV